MKGNCQACGMFRDLDRCHIKTAKTGGTFDDDNILLLCRNDHVRQHSLGFVRFIYRYPHLAKILKQKGWELENVFGVVKLVRVEKQKT